MGRDLGGEVDVFEILAVEDVAGDDGIKPVGCLCAEDAYSGSPYHIGELVTVVVHAEKSGSSSNDVSRYAYQRRNIPVFLAQ